MATNWATGNQKKISDEEVLRRMKRTGPNAKSLIVAAIKPLGEE